MTRPNLAIESYQNINNNLENGILTLATNTLVINGPLTLRDSKNAGDNP